MNKKVLNLLSKVREPEESPTIYTKEVSEELISVEQDIVSRSSFLQKAGLGDLGIGRIVFASVEKIKI